jgi:hypothetical protein
MGQADLLTMTQLDDPTDLFLEERGLKMDLKLRDRTRG